MTVASHRRPSARLWLATGGAVVLAAVLGVALLLRDGGAACAASSKATFYDLGGRLGNCSFPSAPADDLFVALGEADYDGGAACGSYLDVTGPKGKVRVKVIDSCPPCEAGHIDLSRTAFRKIADEVDGIVPVSYRTVRSPSAPGAVSVLLKEGSSAYWLAALIDNHGNRLTSVKINGKAAARTDFNYWIVDGGAGSGPFTVKFTDTSGKTTSVLGIALKPGVTQKKKTASAPKPVVKKKPKPSPSVSTAATPAPQVSTVASPPPTPPSSPTSTQPTPLALAARSDRC